MHIWYWLLLVYNIFPMKHWLILHFAHRCSLPQSFGIGFFLKRIRRETMMQKIVIYTRQEHLELTFQSGQGTHRILFLLDTLHNLSWSPLKHPVHKRFERERENYEESHIFWLRWENESTKKDMEEFNLPHILIGLIHSCSQRFLVLELYWALHIWCNVAL